jgi:hypothetical protein
MKPFWPGNAGVAPFRTTTSSSPPWISSPGGYDWKFVSVAGKTFTDSGSGTCH